MRPARRTDVRRSAVAVVVCGLLSGCLVGPDYVKPKVDTPATFLYEPKEVADTANTEWWRQFDDPVLEQLIVEALANNRNVQIAAANVEQAAGLADAGSRAALPAAQLPGQRWTLPVLRGLHHCPAERREQPHERLQHSRRGKLGDRPVGPHPPAGRIGAGQSARYRRGAPRCDPVPWWRRSPRRTSSCGHWISSSRSRSAHSSPTRSR